MSLSPLQSVALIFTPFTPLFYNSPLISAPSPFATAQWLHNITPPLYITLAYSLTHLLLIRSISLSTFLLLLMPFHSFAPPLYSLLISRCLSTWDIEAIKTGVQKESRASKSVLYAFWRHSLECRKKRGREKEEKKKRLRSVISNSGLHEEKRRT